MELNFFMYILECKDKKYYVGHTDNIEKRLAEHNTGMSHYTSNRLPVKLIYLEQFQTRDEAFVAERKIKGWSRKKKEAYIEKNFDLLCELSNS
jgi:predicted GIY-YIG superfamily endonuclease